MLLLDGELVVLYLVASVVVWDPHDELRAVGQSEVRPVVWLVMERHGCHVVAANRLVEVMQLVVRSSIS